MKKIIIKNKLALWLTLPPQLPSLICLPCYLGQTKFWFSPSFLSPLPKLIDTFEKSLADVRSAWRDGWSAALVVLYNVCVGGRWRSRRGLQPIHWMWLWDAWAAAFNKWILARTQDYGGVQKWNYVNTHQSSDAHWIWMRAPKRSSYWLKNMADVLISA